jgi:hypothetical protein
MKALRRPTRVSAVTYFVRFRRPHDPPVFVSAVALLEELEVPSWPGRWVPVARSAGRFTWTPVGYLRSPGDPSCAFAPLLDPGRTDVPLPWRSHRYCPRFVRQRRLRTMRISGLTHAASAPVSCCHSRARLASGWLAGLYREGVEPSGSLRKVSVHMVIPLSCPPDATHVPYRSPIKSRAAYMPDAAWAVSGIPQAYPEEWANPRF